MSITRVVTVSAVVAFLLVGRAATAQTAGPFKFVRNTDPVTHEDASWIASESSDRAGTLVWKCTGGALNVLYMFGQRVEATGRVAIDVKFASEATPTTVRWDMAEGKRGASMPVSRVDSFTRQAFRSPKVVFRVATTDSKTITSEFGLEGLGAALSKLSCARALAKPAPKPEEAADEEDEVAAEEPENPRVIEVGPEAAGGDWGARFGNVSACTASPGRSGVVVAEILSFGGRAFKAGLKRGDVILEINGQAATSAAQADKMIRSGAGSTVRLLVCRNETRP